jgi:hypothetical protein
VTSLRCVSVKLNFLGLSSPAIVVESHSVGPLTLSPRVFAFCIPRSHKSSMGILKVCFVVRVASLRWLFATSSRLASCPYCFSRQHFSGQSFQVRKVNRVCLSSWYPLWFLTTSPRGFDYHRAKVADFGLSQKQNLGGTGTPFWMAPERKFSAPVIPDGPQ